MKTTVDTTKTTLDIKDVTASNNITIPATVFADLQAERDRYKRALEFYAEGKHMTRKTMPNGFDDINIEDGETARKALQGDA